MANPGDTIKVTTKDEQFEGILMPRPEILEKGITVVKLDSGYNIGIEDKKIKKIEVVKQHKPKKVSTPKLKPKKGLPNVTILSTGGTISSKIDYATGGVSADYSAEDFVAMIPELANIANLKAKKIVSVMSEDMSLKEWMILAKEIEKELNNGADGVVVTQGTDTLHFTSSALSFLLKELPKPVVLTAAQRSIDRGSSDAFMNLFCAITVAAKSDIAEVMICMHGTTNDDYCLLMRGTKVRKMHTSRRDAFRPINDQPLAKVYEDGKIEIITKQYNKRSSGKADIHHHFESKIALVQIYPGMDPEIIDFYVKKGVRGIILSATALGHVPQTMYPNIEKGIKNKVAIIIATQTLYGRVHPYVYSALRNLSIKLQCIFVEDMLPETAFIKLGLVLGHTTKPNEVKEWMLKNLEGELTDRSLNDTFLI